jgi:hypothetical protein
MAAVSSKLIQALIERLAPSPRQARPTSPNPSRTFEAGGKTITPPQTPDAPVPSPGVFPEDITKSLEELTPEELLDVLQDLPSPTISRPTGAPIPRVTSPVSDIIPTEVPIRPGPGTPQAISNKDLLSQLISRQEGAPVVPRTPVRESPDFVPGLDDPGAVSVGGIDRSPEAAFRTLKASPENAPAGQGGPGPTPIGEGALEPLEDINLPSERALEVQENIIERIMRGNPKLTRSEAEAVSVAERIERESVPGVAKVSEAALPNEIKRLQRKLDDSYDIDLDPAPWQERQQQYIDSLSKRLEGVMSKRASQKKFGVTPANSPGNATDVSKPVNAFGEISDASSLNKDPHVSRAPTHWKTDPITAAQQEDVLFRSGRNEPPTIIEEGPREAFPEARRSTKAAETVDEDGGAGAFNEAVEALSVERDPSQAIHTPEIDFLGENTEQLMMRVRYMVDKASPKKGDKARLKKELNTPEEIADPNMPFHLEGETHFDALTRNAVNQVSEATEGDRLSQLVYGPTITTGKGASKVTKQKPATMEHFSFQDITEALGPEAEDIIRAIPKGTTVGGQTRGAQGKQLLEARKRAEALKAAITKQVNLRPRQTKARSGLRPDVSRPDASVQEEALSMLSRHAPGQQGSLPLGASGDIAPSGGQAIRDRVSSRPRGAESILLEVLKEILKGNI